ncbi:E3 ubiquitin-protein ligase TRIM11-like isoform X2 [Tyto alba]|uniref:E3 ubiquitin-protein ligase TRIM11-like isoform X2 n=1 Tax=Tyto alba TaxID=56313 RepID=UPI001C686DE3|nr:E3 ubiquitin-protein ligase TRIM11-like isoform X2 [Tyto alba]
MGEEKIQPHLQSLRKVLAEFLDWRASEEKQRLDYLKHAGSSLRHVPAPREAPNPAGAAGADPGQERSGAERRRIGAEFERLRRFLAEKEREVLGRLAELDAAFEAAHEDKSERVAEGIARLHGLIGQLEAKRSPQGSGSILSSWSEMRLHLPSGLPAELEKSLSSCRRQRAALREALEESRENSDTGSPEAKPSPGKSPSAEERAKAAPVPQLLADRKSVRWDEEQRAQRGEPRSSQEPAAWGEPRGAAGRGNGAG